MLGGLGNDLPAGDVEADVRMELNAAVGAKLVVFIQTSEAFLHPNGMALADALHLGKVQEMNEFMLQTLPRVA